MIINGGSRCNGAFFAKHLTNDEMNEGVRLADIRGLAAKNIGQALYEMKAVASGTRCKNFFYHANLNPYEDERLTADQWERTVDVLEQELGLDGHARFVVEHEKHGRVHRHVVWSRIDVDKMKAVKMPHDFAKHQAVARQIEREFGLRQGKSVLGPEAEKGQRPERRPDPWETFRGKKSGVDVQDLKEEITRLWKGADSAEAFVSALHSHGYILAQGDSRAYCIVDRQGHVHSLARRVEGAKAKDIKEKLAGIDPKDLPHVKEAAAVQRERAEEETKAKGEAQQEQERRQAFEQEETRRQEAIKEEEDRRQQTVQENEQWRQAGIEAENKRQEEFRKQSERQTEQAREMAAQQERLDRYKEVMANYAERERQEMERRQREERDARAREREIRNAGYRYGEALGQHYSMRDPYESLARAAMAEYGMFIRERGRLEGQIAKTADPLERRRLELRRDIEAADYMALTSGRIANQSEIIVGKMNSPEAVKERARAKSFTEQAKAMRQEYQDVVKEQDRGKTKAEPVKEQTVKQEPPPQNNARPAEPKKQEPRKAEEPKQATPKEAAQTGKGEERQREEEGGIFVEERASGRKNRLSSFVRTLPEKKAWRDYTAEEIKQNPKARAAYYSQLAEEKNRNLALNQIRKDLKWGNNLDSEDIKSLSREDLEGIKRHGDQHLKTIVQQHEREKERDRGRER